MSLLLLALSIEPAHSATPPDDVEDIRALVDGVVSKMKQSTTRPEHRSVFNSIPVQIDPDPLGWTGGVRSFPPGSESGASIQLTEGFVRTLLMFSDAVARGPLGGVPALPVAWAQCLQRAFYYGEDCGTPEEFSGLDSRHAWPTGSGADQQSKSAFFYALSFTLAHEFGHHALHAFGDIRDTAAISQQRELDVDAWAVRALTYTHIPIMGLPIMSMYGFGMEPWRQRDPANWQTHPDVLDRMAAGMCSPTGRLAWTQAIADPAVAAAVPVDAICKGNERLLLERRHWSSVDELRGDVREGSRPAAARLVDILMRSDSGADVSTQTETLAAAARLGDAWSQYGLAGQRIKSSDFGSPRFYGALALNHVAAQSRLLVARRAEPMYLNGAVWGDEEKKTAACVISGVDNALQQATAPTLTACQAFCKDTTEMTREGCLAYTCTGSRLAEEVASRAAHASPWIGEIVDSCTGGSR